MQLTDTDQMPFGKFKGKPMQDVPTTYLHWFYHNSKDGERETTDAVRRYVESSIDGLKKENTDLIWDIKPRPQKEKPPF